MHWSLTTGFNVLLVFLWAGMLGVLMAVGAPLPGLALPVAGVGGMLVGALQRHAMGASPDTFREARTALEVRAALWAVASGRAALVVQYAAWVLVFAAVAWRDRSVSAFLVACALYFLARDTASLPGVLRLNRSAA